MVVDVILLQHSSPVVIEINTDLFSAVNSVVSQYWVATCGDPHSGQGIGVNFIALYQTSAIVMLCVHENVNKIFLNIMQCIDHILTLFFFTR